MNSLPDFVWAHREDDPAALALSGSRYPGIPIADAARQVEAIQKIRKKVPDWYRPGLQFPPLLSLEQASSAASARFKASLFSGVNMLDLTGGLGIDSYYFAERFSSATYVEQVAAIFDAARHNFHVLGRHNITTVQTDAADFLSRNHEQFELIYLDPARRHQQKGKVFQLSDCSPDILSLQAQLLEHTSRVLVKTAPMLDIHLAMRQLASVSKVWVVEYEKECREVLYLLERSIIENNQTAIEAVTLNEQGIPTHSFSFNYAEETAAGHDTGMPGKYLYEPFPGILKAGAFKLFGERFGLKKLHRNTHLYTADQDVNPIPARVFHVIAQCPYDRKAVAQLVPDGRANISTRNFPDNPETVKKRLGLRDGGDMYLFAATLADERKCLLLCQKV